MQIDKSPSPIVAAQQDGGLVERLTGYAQFLDASHSSNGAVICRQAATVLAEQDARIAALETELEASRFAERNGKSLAEDSIHAIRELLKAHDVPVAAFIDDHVSNAIAQRDASRAECEGLRAAVTPSAETKAAYSGEFFMGITLRSGREEDYRRVQIPWDSIKTIMAAICARAALSQKETSI